MKMLRTPEPIKTTSHLLGGILTELLKQKQSLGKIGFVVETGCFRCSSCAPDSLPWHVAIVNCSRNSNKVGPQWLLMNCWEKTQELPLKQQVSTSLGTRSSTLKLAQLANVHDLPKNNQRCSPRFVPMTTAEIIVSLWAGTRGYLDKAR